MTAQEDNSDNHLTQNVSDFSIEHILTRAGNSSSSSSSANCNNSDDLTSSTLRFDPYSWLQCTRYCPPKIPRTHKREGPQKRQLGRHPRIPFTSHQLSVLEEKFQQSPYLSSEEVITLSRQLQLADIRVKIWFQNRRARERKEKNKVSAEASIGNEVGGVSAVATTTPESVYNITTEKLVLQNYLFASVNNQFSCTFEDNR